MECTRPLVYLRHTLFATKESMDEAKEIHNAGLVRERKPPMVLGKRQPKWDNYEAAILLDGYLEVLRANLPKARLVKRISQNLRLMQMRRGMAIDDNYLYSYTFDSETGGIILNSTPTKFSKEPRPVYAAEMDVLGFDKYWNGLCRGAGT